MKKLILGTFMLFSFTALSGGFQLNLQSVRGIGLGGAYTGFAYGPASVFFNPGGMCTLKGHNFMVGGNLVFPTVSLQTAAFDNIDMTSGLSTPFHFYYGGELIEDKLYAGLAINNLFGSSSSFEDDWQGRFIIQNISLKTFSFQPTVAYRVDDLFSFGAGFVLTTGNFSTEKAIPLESPTTTEGKASLEGSGLAYSFNIGLYSKPLDNEKMKLTLGASYRHSQKINLDNGTATFTSIPTSLQSTFPGTTGFTSSLTLPQVMTAGLAFTYKLKEEHSIMATYDFNYTMWTSYDTLAIDFEHEDTPDSKTAKEWQNTPTHRFGLEYSFKEMLYIRVGGYYDVTPIQDGYVSPELPDANQFVPTAGIGVMLKERVGIDFSWLHQDSKRTATLDAAGWNASYHRIADVFSLSLSVKI